MKKFYLLLSLLLVSLSYAQSPIITMFADGDESGGTPKVLEIYANGTVDFTQYSLENQTNGNTTWGNTFDLSPLGTVTDAFVYVIKDGMIGPNSDQSAFALNFPSVTSGSLDTGTSSVININGNDRFRIIITTTSAVVDAYGVDGVDGTGEAWEYKDGYAKRANGTGPDAVFVEANWTYANGALDHNGAVQNGTTFESIIGIGTYVPSTSTTPTLAITSPTPGQVFAPNVASVDVNFTVQNFNVANGTGDGHIHWRLDGGSWNMQYDTNPIQLTGLTRASHTVDVKLVDNSHADLVPPVESSVTFAVADYVQVADMATLRAQQLNGYYHYTGEAFAIAGEAYSSGNLKGFVQDATGGMMAFVPAGTTSQAVNGNDGITDLKGKLIDYHGVLELEVTEDFTLTGNNVVQVPQVITADELNNNHDDYESELIEIDNATIDPAGATLFAHSHNYDLTDASATTVLRTMFSDMTDVAIPTGTVNVVGIGGEYNGTAQIFPREANDITTVSAVAQNNIDGFKVYPNPVTNGQVYVTSTSDDNKKVIVYDLLGKAVISTEVNNNQAVDVSTLRSGVYMMKVIENGQVAVRKLMIK